MVRIIAWRKGGVTLHHRKNNRTPMGSGVEIQLPAGLWD